MRFFNRSLPLLLACLTLSLAEVRAELKVRTDFPGGSARVLKVDEAARRVRIMPGGDSKRGWTCWWAVRLEGLQAGQTYTLELAAPDQPQYQPGPGLGKPLSASWSRPQRPSLSQDGKVWRHGEEGRVQEDVMVYEIKPEGGSLWVAWGPVFTPETAEALLAEAAPKLPEAGRFTLATTREGRPVQAMLIAPGAGKPVLWLQARQHAWESGGSWVGAGLLRWLASDEAAAKTLRQKAEIVFVPVMDVDHVSTGDGGKDALPQDHNRDWMDEPHWPEVAAAQQRLLGYAKEKRLRVFCDLHNPAPGDKKAFFFVSPKDMMPDTAWAAQRTFIDLVRQEFAGNPIPLEITPRESGASYHPLWRQISKNWVHEKCGHQVLSLTLETAWNTPGSTVEGYEKTGACLGRALLRYLEAVPE